MYKNIYANKVELLLSALPEVAAEKDFALHGGTAINFFIRNMPRLSVDIDLTYIPINSRQESLGNISDGLNNIKSKLKRAFPDINIEHHRDIGKLVISRKSVQIKLEVNLVGRGLIKEAMEMPLVDNVSKQYRNAPQKLDHLSVDLKCVILT